MRNIYLKTLLICVVAAQLYAADVDFVRDLKPVLRERCFACHGALKQEAGLRLDSARFLVQGGDSGKVVAAADAEASELLRRVMSKDESERMPPEGQPLTQQQIEMLRNWIQAGANLPKDDTPEEDPRNHWAFRRVVAPNIPSQADNSNPIDAFIQTSQAKLNLRPLGSAPKPMLLRRAYLDLIGVPPAYDEIQDFIADKSPNAYEKVVRRLLHDPRHGERWARHWMDIWRYTDWYGLGSQLRNSQKHIWHWRDWIIESLNFDKGYNRMVLEMLAADELMPTDADALRGTGFLARNYYLFNRTTWLDETIEHTSKALLGLTMNCSKCHDHKYDPITQVDYYRMRAFFEPYHVRLDAVPGEMDLEKDGLPRIFDMHLDRPTHLHIRGDAKNPDKSEALTPGVPELLNHGSLDIASVNLPTEAHLTALQSFVLRDHLRSATRQIATAEANLKQSKSQIEAARQGAEHPIDSGKPIVADDFSKRRDEFWAFLEGDWKIENSDLRQTQTGNTRRSIRCKKKVPRDFVAKLKFTIDGGRQWKSVGICFDVAKGREEMVYLSAHAGGPKLQYSFQRNGGQSYPTEGLRKYPVKIGSALTLRIAVRDQLLNASVNGEHLMAYKMSERQLGHLDLIAFDAAVRFHEVEIRELPVEARLYSPGQSTVGDNPWLAEAEFKLNDAKLKMANCLPEAIKSAFNANQAKAGLVDAEILKTRVHRASLAKRKLEVAEARVALAQAERSLITETDKVKAAKAVNGAKTRLTAAIEQLENPGTEYYSIVASRRAFTGPAEKTDARFNPYPTTSTGRRSALAKWIISRENPLTSRVAVNHIWMRHLGQPLVESVTDFGRRAKRPVQQNLLDWLAVDLMEHDWSMKRLHYLIVTSDAYRRSSSTSGAEETTLSEDPNNDYYWRRRPNRMDAQVLRDSVIHLANATNSTIGGPTIKPVAKDNAFRRSLYFRHSRDDRAKFLSMFDDADILNCYRRIESIVPQQALALSNSEISLTLSRRIAEQIQTSLEAQPLVQSGPAERAFIQRAFVSMIGRQPNGDELLACIETMDAWMKLLAAQKSANATSKARGNLIHALMNHNDFITIR